MAVLLASVLCGGCAGDLRTVMVGNEREGQICRVAVLPFFNESEDRTAALRVTRIFESVLIQSEGFEILPEGEVYRYLTLRRLTPGDLQAPSSEVLEDLRRHLQVDAFVCGKVLESAVRRNTYGMLLPHLTLQVDLVDLRSGVLVARSFHRRSGEDYRKFLHLGVETTSSALAERMSREIVRNWKKNGVGQCPS